MLMGSLHARKQGDGRGGCVHRPGASNPPLSRAPKLCSLRGLARTIPVRRLALRWLVFLCALLITAKSYAAVAILLEQPYGEMDTLLLPSGHTALYFDHICAATPLQLRPCRPGELGVVLSRYDGIGTYDWVAVSLLPYLYAVDSPNEIPTSVDRLDVVRMRDLYRREHLEQVAPDTETGGMPQGNWYELLGSAYDREIYGFRVNTTSEQDAHLIALFNDRPNMTQYSGGFSNCADFVRVTINRLYPHAIRRNYIADFGFTSPKSVARGLTHYARKHPETGFTVFRIPQVRSDLPRSGGAEGLSEYLLKHYGVPLSIVSPYVPAAMLVAYVGHGRFAVPKNAPTLDFEAMEVAASATSAAFPWTGAGAGTPVRVEAMPIDFSKLMTATDLPATGVDAPTDFLTATVCPECTQGDAIP